MVIVCQHTPTLGQFDVLNHQDLEDKLSEAMSLHKGASRNAPRFIRHAFQQNVRLPSQTSSSDVDSDSIMEALYPPTNTTNAEKETPLKQLIADTLSVMKLWAKTPISELSLSPIGAAVGFAYLKKFFPKIAAIPPDFLG
jgi:hypothetical protein